MLRTISKSISNSLSGVLPRKTHSEVTNHTFKSDHPSSITVDREDVDVSSKSTSKSTSTSTSSRGNLLHRRNTNASIRVLTKSRGRRDSVGSANINPGPHPNPNTPTPTPTHTHTHTHICVDTDTPARSHTHVDTPDGTPESRSSSVRRKIDTDTSKDLISTNINTNTNIHTHTHTNANLDPERGPGTPTIDTRTSTPVEPNGSRAPTAPLSFHTSKTQPQIEQERQTLTATPAPVAATANTTVTAAAAAALVATDATVDSKANSKVFNSTRRRTHTHPTDSTTTTTTTITTTTNIVDAVNSIPLLKFAPFVAATEIHTFTGTPSTSSQSVSSSYSHLDAIAALRPADADSVLARSDTSITTPSSGRHADQHDTEIIMQRKIWVKRPGASATLVAVNEDDLVDTVRDVILNKYANSLGRTIDSPDITLKIVSREQSNKNVPAERTLGPEEHIGHTLDLYYSGGQTIEEALLVDVPPRRTPKASPRLGNHHHYIPGPFYLEEHPSGDGAREYFPPMPVHSPAVGQHPSQANGVHLPHSMAVLTTGQLPPLPSPGGHGPRRERHGRPKYSRQHTSSPTIMHSSQPSAIDSKPSLNGVAPSAPPLPTPPANNDHRPSITPPNRATSPHALRSKRKKQTALNATKSTNGDPPPNLKPASAGLLDGTVPPINVLIVEDNVINLKVLEAFMKRLKVRWKSAMNGKEAVNMWRTGGFHLVLMDIQLPVMNGLEATKEIRRLESVNGIGLGIVGGVPSEGRRASLGLEGADQLGDRGLFKSPVIIVALTASSLQSDRHEALAAGCNDFLTKPVNFVWMERKVTEWGCMQALIDFDGWRAWKQYASKKDEGLSVEEKKAQEKEERTKQKAALKAMFARPPPSTKVEPTPKDTKREEKRSDDSTSKSPTPVLLPPTGRNLKGSRSGSGSSTVASLETHAEVDE